MAIISCPECGGKISDTITVCPHCGYHLSSHSTYERTQDEDIIIASRSRSGTAVSAGVILILIGLFLVIAFVGIFLVIFGAINISQGRANNNNPHECAYYNPSKDKITLYSFDGVKHVVSPKDIISASHPFGTENMYVKINKYGKVIKVDCGNCPKQGVIQFNSYLNDIREGSFNIENI